jgi:hypothetical protein
MEPTMFLRWDERRWNTTHKANSVTVAVGVDTTRVLQQFWIVGSEEADFTLPKDVSPDGLYFGRWRDV